jgi:hypothetical protein
MHPREVNGTNPVSGCPVSLELLYLLRGTSLHFGMLPNSPADCYDNTGQIAPDYIFETFQSPALE